MRWRRAVGGLAVAVVVVTLLVYGLGWDDVVSTVRTAHPGALAAALVSGLGILALRALVVERLLGPVAGGARGGAFAAAYLSGYFARSALPWGRSTGTPITAYLLADASDSEFEDNLAVVAAAEGFNALSSIVVAVIGFVAFAATSESEAVTSIATAIVVVGVAGAVATVAVVAGFNRGIARSTLLAASVRVEAGLERLPYVNPGESVLAKRVHGFFDTLRVIQASRRTIAVAFSVAVVSWMFNSLPLYFCLLAIGVDAPLALALVCAPLASFGGVVPLPGGSGGIEVVLTSLLVATLGVSAGDAGAVAVLYRLTTYWAHLAVTGVVAVIASVTGFQRL
ncbi:lysylphosphatidylglycerol synthase transmembrane domain-containing protein [Natrarchaeobius oligotrophus]|uniref:UPF0104 family protein n=1 Tax=Natrarchaeobius chitinivorans TaxID=1679083 RepID=A0A3N6MD61_NATCH|nr:lysylphosphatidylglycerol synthase transmembrane domain-containing protein [Natrarchaeobius chitinivorans]RQG98694.1 UPF0104 family protein [Natrarchaeobius chitinivorans]